MVKRVVRGKEPLTIFVLLFLKKRQEKYMTFVRSTLSESFIIYMGGGRTHEKNSIPLHCFIYCFDHDK
jgi:hypothetical protein